ncbi:MAG: HpcH/HpaI aldolase/citrate lyase family protein [Candidatus Azotimanducaceae bacterium]
MATIHLRRSLHFVPGANDKMFSKSLASSADSLILDLEDAVTPKKKDDARQVIKDWLNSADFSGKEKTVRINPIDSPWGLKDIEVVMQGHPDSLVIPKVSSYQELQTLDDALTHWESQLELQEKSVNLILITTETPASILNLPSFTDCERVAALSWGAEDLAASLGSTRNRGPDGSYLDIYKHCRNMTLICAAAGNVQPIDTVFVDFKDSKGLQNDCEEASWMGYTGKMTIHPDQLEVVNAAFSPGETEVSAAKRLIEAFAEAEKQGLMAIAFEGQMVDVPHLNRAKKLLARAALIEQVSS